VLTFHTLQNKMWHCVRFLKQAEEILTEAVESGKLASLEAAPTEGSASLEAAPTEGSASLLDRWLLHQTHQLILVANDAFETRRLHTLVHAFNRFWRNQFADVFIEAFKPSLFSGEQPAHDLAHLATATRCLELALRCVAPLMPYLSEELLTRLPLQRGDTHSVFGLPYPCPATLKGCHDPSLDESVRLWCDVLSVLRRTRAECAVPGRDVRATLHTRHPSLLAAPHEMVALVERVALAGPPQSGGAQRRSTLGAAAAYRGDGGSRSDGA